MKRLCFFSLAAVSLWLSMASAATAQDAVKIQSVGTMEARIPIAVPAFATGPGATAFGRDLASIIAADLDFSGLFNIVPQVRYPKDFRGFTSDAGKIDFIKWRETPAEHVVYGYVSLRGDTLVAECRLFDVLVSQQVVGKRLQSDRKWARLLAHQFADEIVHYLTGDMGIASTEICFSAGETGKKEIYIADYDAGRVTKVTSHGSISIKPKFSPDGQKVAYLSYKDGFPFLYIYDRTTGRSTPLSKRSGLNHAPAWAPNGRFLALCLSKDGNTEIYLKNADGTGERRLTSNRAGDTSPTFSPDARKIAFVSDRGGRPHIYTMNVDGSRVRRISVQGGNAFDPAWSPDGKSIAYVVEKSGEGLEIYLMDTDGKNSRRLSDSAGSNESPTWSPDSRHIMFLSTRAGISQLYTVTLETGIVRRVPRVADLRCQGPSWGPRRN